MTLALDDPVQLTQGAAVFRRALTRRDAPAPCKDSGPGATTTKRRTPGPHPDPRSRPQ